MFHCERCRSSFHPTVAATAFSCPRCRGRDGVESALKFRLFEPSPPGPAGGEIEVEHESGSASSPTGPPGALA